MRIAFQPFDGRFKGARVLATADRRAAMLEYTVLGGHRVTVYVFNTRMVPMQATQLEPETPAPAFDPSSMPTPASDETSIPAQLGVSCGDD